MIAIEYLAAAVAAGLAFVAAQRRASVRVLAWLLAWEVAQDLGRRALSSYVLDPFRAAHGTPYLGWARVAFHVREALQVSWCFAVVAVVARVLGRRVAPWLWPTFLLVIATATIGYPAWLRGTANIGVYYAVIQAIEVSWCGAFVLSFVRRSEGALMVEHVSVFWMVAVELAVLTAYVAGGIFEWWPVAATLYLAMHTGLILVQGRWLWTSARDTSRS